MTGRPDPVPRLLLAQDDAAAEDLDRWVPIRDAGGLAWARVRPLPPGSGDGAWPLEVRPG